MGSHIIIKRPDHLSVDMNSLPLDLYHSKGQCMITSGTLYDIPVVKAKIMKNLQLALLGFAIMLLSSCEVVGGIFKAGVWTGIIAVAVVVFLIIFLVSRGRK
ncbi:hypothetical protein SAMN05661012_02568 [Chitinophaga sancti]|uniref:Uncharacterized protein n=2 Tax=Chitinophaga sancti TaxID=1004 RepID=A0A1K1QB51_9BACT|nr:hypothetical protein SAMN05661012_02568 [Chitinophaga sancti]